MKKRTPAVKTDAPAGGHPRCTLCRDGKTYATQSMQMFDGDEESRQNYCDVCGKAMASVLHDAQHRDPVITVLPPPPPPAVEVVALPAPKVAAPVPKVAAPKVNSVRKEMAEAGYDLLAMLGMKR